MLSRTINKGTQVKFRKQPKHVWAYEDKDLASATTDFGLYANK